MGLPGSAFKSPKHLCPCIRAMYYQLADAFWEQAGESLTVIETLRDEERQHYYVSIGSSRTMKSKHLPQPPSNLSLAFDVAPSSYLSLKLWFPKGPHWQTMGTIGARVGLQWGGVIWLPSWEDKPHFQLAECRCDHS